MAFTCPVCKLTSHHPKDEEYGYCGNCRAFTGARVPRVDFDMEDALEAIFGKGEEITPGITIYGGAADKLMYAEPKKGEDFKLYIFFDYRDDAHWFTSRKIRHPEEQMAASAALSLARSWMQSGREVRVTDAGEMLVFHANGGKVLYPEGVTIEEFWERL